MTIEEFLAAIGAAPDGQFGPLSRAALLTAFTNPRAPAVTVDALNDYAALLGCSAKQLRAVALVESSGSGFDTEGRPKRFRPMPRAPNASNLPAT